MSKPTTDTRYGIDERSLELIIEAIESRPEIERVVLFGSRAMGNAKHGSDIDLAIAGSGVTETTASALAEHIRAEGRELYRRNRS